MPPLEQVFKGRRILVTGATGFLGKVFLAMLLRWHPEIEKIYLLIRGDRRSSIGRYRREILDSPAMTPVRAHLGAEFDAQPSYSRQSSFAALRSYSYKVGHVLPFLRGLRILRQWAGSCDISADFSPIMGSTGVDGFLVTTGWGTWGFKAIPAGGEALAERIATGRTPPLIAPFSLERFRRDHVLADQASAGTR